MINYENYKELIATLKIEIAEWKLAEAKGTVNQWGYGYIRGLENAKEWVEAAFLNDLAPAKKEQDE